MVHFKMRQDFSTSALNAGNAAHISGDAVDAQPPKKQLAAHERQKFAQQMFSAFQEKDFDTIMDAVRAGADVNTNFGTGNTPMMWAATLGAAELIEFLADHDAGLEDPHNGGATPFLIAVYHAQTKAAKTLLEKGANINARKRDGSNAVVMAASSTNPEKMLKFVEEVGLGIDAPDDEGVTPLMRATVIGDEDTVKTLMAHGADPLYRHPDGYSALSLAQKPAVKAVIQEHVAHKQEKHAKALYRMRRPGRPGGRG